MNFSAGDADNQEDNGQQEASNGRTDEYQQGQGIWNMNRIKKNCKTGLISSAFKMSLSKLKHFYKYLNDKKNFTGIFAFKMHWN